MSTTTPPPRVRLTVSLPLPVHEAFTRLSNVTGRSIGSEIGDFLMELTDSVDFIALKMEQARLAPGLVMRELHAFAQGLADETGSVIGKASGRGAAVRSERSDVRPAAPIPPRPVIRGGKSSGKGRSKGGTS